MSSRSDVRIDDAIGYVVTSLSDRGKWQGFFVVPSYEQQGEAILREVRKANEQAGPQGGGTEVSQALSGPSDGDQVAVGSLSAVLAELFTMGLSRPPPPPEQAEAIMAAVGAATWTLAVEGVGPTLADRHGHPCAGPRRPGDEGQAH